MFSIPTLLDSTTSPDAHHYLRVHHGAAHVEAMPAQWQGGCLKQRAEFLSGKF